VSALARIVLENVERARIMERLAFRRRTTEAEKWALMRAAVHFDDTARRCAELVIGAGC
jgi:hypothetical protein